jgi:FkbM family methyltransferase
MSRQEFSFTLTAPNGVHKLSYLLDPAQMSQRAMLEDFAAGRLYESETSNFIGTLLQPGDTFIDIGAHVGYFSMLAAALVGPTGTVYSFEPEPSNFLHLVEHIDANSFTQIRPIHMAVGARPGVGEFFVNADNDGGHALWDVGRHPFNERSRVTPNTRKVYITSLDEFFGTRDMSRLKAIKIDAEGAEFAILVGARKLIAQYRIPFVIAEVNRFGLESMGASENMLRSVMSELGYETYQSPETNYVFNVLFRHPEAPALAA